MGAHTQFTILKYPCLGPPLTPSGIIYIYTDVYSLASFARNTKQGRGESKRVLWAPFNHSVQHKECILVWRMPQITLHTPHVLQRTKQNVDGAQGRTHCLQASGSFEMLRTLCKKHEQNVDGAQGRAHCLQASGSFKMLRTWCKKHGQNVDVRKVALIAYKHQARSRCYAQNAKNSDKMQKVRKVTRKHQARLRSYAHSGKL